MDSMFNTLTIAILKFVFLCAIVLFGLWVLVARPVFWMSSESDTAPTEVVNAEALKKHVEMLSVKLVPRAFENPLQLSKTADYISDVFRSYGAEPREQVYDINDAQYKNIITEFGPADGPLVVIGAHYDAAGALPGADDNASGVAGLLELGRLLMNTELSSRVMLVAFTLEEPPVYGTEFMGSAVFARSLKEANEDVELMISLEMIGYFTDEPESQGFPNPVMGLIYPTTGNYIAIIDTVFSSHASKLKKSMKRHINLPVHSINAPRFVPGIDFSDHRNFWSNGYPGIMVTDTAFYRNRAYHTANDVAQRLDFNKMSEVVYGVYKYISSPLR